MMTLSRNPMLLIGAAFVLAACDSASDGLNDVSPPPRVPIPPSMATFDVTVTNLTNSQPLSPVGVIAHTDGYAVFSVGTSATVGLEELAEGGDNTALLAEADADANVLATASGAAPIGPGGSEAISIQVLESELPGLRISVSTMLISKRIQAECSSGILSTADPAAESTKAIESTRAPLERARIERM